jgi:hypothetical protein
LENPSDRFLKEPVMPEPELSAEAKKLLRDLRLGGLAFNRKEAAEKIGKLKESSEALVFALIQVREFDGNEEVRKAAGEALLSPAHRAVLKKDSGLEQRASVPPKKSRLYSVYGILSYVFALIAVSIVYLDLFVIGPQLPESANPLGLGVSSVVINSYILFVGSFVLPTLGVVSGIMAIRQYDRKPVLGIIGLVGNALILFMTSYSVISRQ